MAKKQEPGIALPGQLEGPDTHFSTDMTANPQPVKDSHPTGDKAAFPKYVFVKEGDEVKHVLVNNQEELDALPAGWTESPADHDVPAVEEAPVVEEPKAE